MENPEKEQAQSMEENGFLKMLQTVDAYFPVGLFTLSNGLEDYVISEELRSCEDLEQYIADYFTVFPYQDLGLLSISYRKAQNRDALKNLDGLAGAMKPAREIREGSARTCSRFLKLRRAMGDVPDCLHEYADMIDRQQVRGYYPIALGLYAAGAGIGEKTVLTLYSYNILSSIVNNAVKLVPLSQMKGQRVLLQALDRIPEAVQTASTAGAEDLGCSGPNLEYHCMHHEKLYSRQFMS